MPSAVDRLDTLFTAETPEGIALALRPAGLTARSLAYLVDLGIRLGLFILIAIVARALGGLGATVMLLSYFALEWLYPVVFELGRSGATPGKRALGLRVVMDSGLPVTPAASLIRNLLRAADFLPSFYGAGIVAVLLRDDCKRLGDIAGGTLVVFNGGAPTQPGLPEAEPRPPAVALSAREQASLIACAGRAHRLTPERLDELAALAGRVLPPSLGDEPASARLLGAAQWLLGRRSGGPGR